LATGLLLLLFASPLSTVIFGSFKTSAHFFQSPAGLPAHPSLDNYQHVLQRTELLTGIRNSVIVLGISLPATIIVSLMAAYFLARRVGRISRTISTLLGIGLALPSQTVLVSQLEIVRGLHLDDTLHGLVLANLAGSISLSVFVLTAFLRTIPKELYEAAEIDGGSHFTCFRSIAIPWATPAIASATAFVGVSHWNEYLYPLVFTINPKRATLPLVLARFRGDTMTNYPVMFAGLVVAALPVIIGFRFLQRNLGATLTAATTFPGRDQ
jgi:raffinose/stachyose/melibiose transport system permease protein